MNVQPEIKYKVTKNIFTINLFNSFSTINFIPHEIKVARSKNEIIPKLCKRKSEMILPYMPK